MPTVEQIKSAVLHGSEYAFLRTNAHLCDRIIFLTLSGSYAYGTNTDTSDIDVRGCALQCASDLIGFSQFEQFVDDATDTTVYGFNKLIQLLLTCNPNTIELLGCRPEHYIIMTDIGHELLANRRLFLSQRAVDSFGGYANSQLRRLENALARDRLPQARKEEHILKTMLGMMKSFEDRYTAFEKGSVVLYTADSPREDLDREVFANINLKAYPVREFNGLINDLTNVIGVYDKLNHRNHKKDEAHLNKHAMHLVRLYLMCLDILEKEEIITYRAAERDMLLDIRRGAYQNADGSYRQEFFELIDEYEKRLDYAKHNTSLPPAPDMRRIEEFVMSVNRRCLDVR